MQPKLLIGIHHDYIASRTVSEINRLINIAKGRSGYEWPQVLVLFEDIIGQSNSVDAIVAGTQFSWKKIVPEYHCGSHHCYRTSGLNKYQLDYLLFTGGVYNDEYYRGAKANQTKIHILDNHAF